jgi:predicted regulator of Ras-like GTPase activity (Roadblock/LC7/MglB family)
MEQLLQEVRSELGGDFVSTNVVGMDGLSIGGNTADPNFNAEAASARFAMVSKLGGRVSDKLKMGGVDDILVTTDQAYLLTRILGDGSYYWGLAVTKDATLGMVRMLMNEYADQLWAAVPR